MKVRHALVLVMSTVSVAMFSGLLSAAPASAATSDCPAQYACGWRDSGYETGGTGNNIRFISRINNMGTIIWNDTEDTVNDSISSLYNNGNTNRACWYTNASQTGTSTCLNAKAPGNNNLGSLNDNISSGKFV